jgi:hypothetical protein
MMKLEAASRVGAAKTRRKVDVHVAATRQKEWKRRRRKTRGRVHFQRSKEKRPDDRARQRNAQHPGGLLEEFHPP